MTDNRHNDDSLAGGGCYGQQEEDEQGFSDEAGGVSLMLDSFQIVADRKSVV